jgi:hypothetical protein
MHILYILTKREREKERALAHACTVVCGFNLPKEKEIEVDGADAFFLLLARSLFGLWHHPILLFPLFL